MTNDFIALSHLTDTELLQRVYMGKSNPAITPLALELATRLEHALNELAKPPLSVEDAVQKAVGGR